MRIDTLIGLLRSSEPVSCAVIEQDCTLALVILTLNDSYDVGVDVLFPYSNYCPQGFMPYPVKCLLEVYVEILLKMQVYLDLDIEYLFGGVLWCSFRL